MCKAYQVKTREWLTFYVGFLDISKNELDYDDVENLNHHCLELGVRCWQMRQRERIEIFTGEFNENWYLKGADKHLELPTELNSHFFEQIMNMKILNYSNSYESDNFFCIFK